MSQSTYPDNPYFRVLRAVEAALDAGSHIVTVDGPDVIFLLGRVRAENPWLAEDPALNEDDTQPYEPVEVN